MSLRIDRTSFLTLTFGMAGVACNSGPAAAVVASVVDIPPQPPQPADGGAVALATLPSPSTPRAVPSAASSPDDDDEPGAPTDESGATVLTPLPGGSQGCGWVDPKTLPRPSSTCNDDRGAAPSCAVMKSCAGFPFPRQECETYRRLFKPKVAEKALDCLAKLTTTQVCDACNTYRCGNLALKSACPDPSVDAQCMQIATRCPAVSLSECRLHLSGLNGAGRAKMVSCLVTKSGCGFGIYSCSESL